MHRSCPSGDSHPGWSMGFLSLIPREQGIITSVLFLADHSLINSSPQRMAPDLRRKVDATRAARLSREAEMHRRATAQVSISPNFLCCFSLLHIDQYILAILYHTVTHIHIPCFESRDYRHNRTRQSQTRRSLFGRIHPLPPNNTASAWPPLIAYRSTGLGRVLPSTLFITNSPVDSNMFRSLLDLSL